MHRNMDCVRDILMSIADENPEIVKKYSKEELGYHGAIMIEAGLVIGEAPQDAGMLYPTFAYFNRLTWKGHDFLDAAREDGRWSLAKKTIAKVEGATCAIWIALLTKYIEQTVGL